MAATCLQVETDLTVSQVRRAGLLLRTLPRSRAWTQGPAGLEPHPVCSELCRCSRISAFWFPRLRTRRGSDLPVLSRTQTARQGERTAWCLSWEDSTWWLFPSPPSALCPAGPAQGVVTCLTVPVFSGEFLGGTGPGRRGAASGERREGGRGEGRETGGELSSDNVGFSLSSSSFSSHHQIFSV